MIARILTEPTIAQQKQHLGTKIGQSILAHPSLQHAAEMSSETLCVLSMKSWLKQKGLCKIMAFFCVSIPALYVSAWRYIVLPSFGWRKPKKLVPQSRAEWNEITQSQVLCRFLPLFLSMDLHHEELDTSVHVYTWCWEDWLFIGDQHGLCWAKGRFPHLPGWWNACLGRTTLARANSIWVTWSRARLCLCLLAPWVVLQPVSHSCTHNCGGTPISCSSRRWSHRTVISASFILRLAYLFSSHYWPLLALLLRRRCLLLAGRQLILGSVT